MPYIDYEHEKIGPHTSHQILEVTANLRFLLPHPAYNSDLTPCDLYFKFKHHFKSECVNMVIHYWLHQQAETFFHSCIIAVLFVGINMWNFMETNKIIIEIFLLAVLLCMFLLSIMRKHFSEKKKN
jgi:hypothetical protein